MQSSPRIGGAGASTGKETFCTALGSVLWWHCCCTGWWWYSSYSHCPGGYPTWRRYLLQPNMSDLVFRGCLALALMAPLLPPLKGGWQKIGTNHSLIKARSFLPLVESRLCHQRFACAVLAGRLHTAFNTDVSLWGCPSAVVSVKWLPYLWPIALCTIVWCRNTVWQWGIKEF